jgi:hypothetical protein
MVPTANAISSHIRRRRFCLWKAKRIKNQRPNWLWDEARRKPRPTRLAMIRGPSSQALNNGRLDKTGLLPRQSGLDWLGNAVLERFAPGSRRLTREGFADG